MKLTDIEQEVIFLKAITESIDLMVNYENITLSEGNGGSEARFKTAIHQRFFNIVLVDFLSKSAEEITGKSESCLSALARICEKPNFNHQDSIKSLFNAISTFTNWLKYQIEVDKVWLSAIGLEIKLMVSREEFITVCGNISKHNFSRLSRMIKKLKEILARSDIKLSDEEGLLILEDFYEWFHADILSYHASSIVEQLNNIRWGIHEYLMPEFNISIVYEGGNPPKYRYTYPHGINTGFAKNCYWELMNEVRATPYVKRFKTYDILKQRY